MKLGGPLLAGLASLAANSASRALLTVAGLSGLAVQLDATPVSEMGCSPTGTPVTSAVPFVDTLR